MLELNDVLIAGERSTLSMMAREGQVTCLVGDGRWLHAMMGFEPVVCGFISIDGEPVTPATAPALRQLMAYVPHSLDAVGEVVVYKAPTVQDVFALKANRQLDISNGMLSEEMKRTGVSGQTAQLLAVATLLRRSIMLVDSPPAAAAAYLRRQAEAGRTVIVASTDEAIISMADMVVET